ncbi:hypothetical protein [Streptomyces sp. NPDC058664]|uniref:hypothetical protein n=1 Tax=unclassified Streptomyces TaxID=2593676 RepID=UPI0036543792
MCCPTHFVDPVFREATPGERAEATRLVGAEPPVLVAFEADGGGTEPAVCLIAAEDRAIRRGRFPRGT